MIPFLVADDHLAFHNQRISLPKGAQIGIHVSSGDDERTIQAAIRWRTAKD